MMSPDPSAEAPRDGSGGRTSASGTPVPVAVQHDRQGRLTAVVFLGGPVIWLAYFLFVYLVAEAGCTGSGPGLRAFDPPVPRAVTLIATAAATVACIGLAAWGYRRWSKRSVEPKVGETGAGSVHSELGESHRSLAFSGFLLSLLSLVTILYVGLPATVFPSC